MSDRSLQERFRRHVAPTSDAPLALEIAEARGATVLDVDGKDYVDLLAGMGVANVGHRHPEVVEAIRAQADRYLHAMVYGEYVQAPQVALAERIAGLLPAPLETVYFTNSGAEAIEGAIKLVRKATGRSKLVAFEGSFHGDTTGALALGGNPAYRDPFLPLLADVELLPFDEDESLARIDEATAGVFVELVQAEGGVRMPREGWVDALAQRAAEVGARLVVDEVVTGFGRTGTRFAIDHFGIVPDVVVLAKALGGGMPLGAFVASPDLLRVLAEDPPLGHVTTFGGHPVSCAAGLAALEVMEREHLPERAERVGAELRTRLRELPWEGRLVEVRGRGMLIGLELTTPEATRAFAAAAFGERVVLNWTLHRDRVIRLAPPLVITEAEVDEALARLARALCQRSR